MIEQPTPPCRLFISTLNSQAIKESRHGFFRLPLFVYLVFYHDALHATLNSGKRMMDLAFRMGKGLDLQHGTAIEKAIAKMLRMVNVHSGRPTNEQGVPIKGPNVAWVVKQWRGSQFETATLKGQVWRAFADAGYPELADAFETMQAGIYVVHHTLAMGASRAAVWFYGRTSGQEEQEANVERAVDLVERTWKAVLQHACKLFPGDCDSSSNPVFATNAFMSRSVHTTGHLSEHFHLDEPPMDARPIEEMQGILRQLLHQATTGHQLNELNSEGLITRVATHRAAQVQTAEKGLESFAIYAIKAHENDHTNRGGPVGEWMECLLKRNRCTCACMCMHASEVS